MNILQVNSSIRGAASASTRIAKTIVAHLQASDPAARVTVRELHDQPLLDPSTLGAIFTPAESRDSDQSARVAIDDATIAQVKDADVLVLAVPMYNFGVPVQLKAWIDSICRAGVTFRYTPAGPEGLLTGKKVYVALSRGGVYRDTALDSQTPYLKAVLGFLGMTDVTFIHAEGLSKGPEAVEKAFSDAESEIAALKV